jgi:tRNA modification GTPase
MDLNLEGTGTSGGEGVVVSVLTPAGRGALAVVGVAGPVAGRLVDGLLAPRSGRPVGGRPGGSVAFGRWGGAGGEEVVVLRRPADALEVHCHGGVAAPAAIVAELVARGAREIPWRDWLATVDGDGGEIGFEARAALAAAGGPQAAKILCRQLAGALDAALLRIARLAAAGDEAAARTGAARLVRAARVGLRLTRPWRVVVAGRVNAGKSSLVNALAGHARALVSSVPGTTRDVLETRIVLEGWEIDLVDTAGDRGDDRPAGPVEVAGIARAAAAAGTADLVLRVVAADEGGAVPQAGPREVIVLSKCDLPQAAAPPADAVRTSAATGAGIGELGRRIVAAVVPEETADPELLAGAVPFTPRQLEAIRKLGGG